MEQKYWLNVRDKLGFLSSVMKELASENSQIIFEGNLSSFNFTEIAKDNKNSDLNKNTISLRLTEENIKAILKEIQPGGKFVNEILEIEIRKNGEPQLLVGDNFHNECISVGPMVSLDLLSKLKEMGIIRKIQTNAEARSKYSWFKNA